MKKSKTSLFEWVGDVILLLIMLIVILPLLWLFVSSFKSDADVIKWPPHFFPAPEHKQAQQDTQSLP